MIDIRLDNVISPVARKSITKLQLYFCRLVCVLLYELWKLYNDRKIFIADFLKLIFWSYYFFDTFEF